MKTKLFLVLSFFAIQFSHAFTVVLSDPTAPALAPLTYCDPDSDGIGSFDLTQQIPLILAAQTGNTSGYTVTFHETMMDANNSGNPITGLYINIQPYTQTIYYRVFIIATGDFAVGSFQIVVNSAPLVSTPPNISMCDDNNDGLSNFNLASLIPEILGVINPSMASVTFYTTMSAAEVGLSPIIPNYSYVGTSGETIYTRVTFNDTGCYTVVSFHLIVNPKPVIITPTPLQVCDNDATPNNQYIAFNLTVKNAEITQGRPGYVVTYYPSFSNAVAGTNPIANPSAYMNVAVAIQTLGVAVTNPSTGCVSYTTLDIRVLPIPNPNTNPPALAPKCDDNLPGDMLEVFDLTVNEVYMRNGDPTLTFHYFTTANDALNNTNEIMTPTAALVGNNVWIRVENNRVDYQNNHCYALVEQRLTVNPLPNPVITTLSGSNTVYVDNSNAVVRPLLLNSGINGDYTYQWYLGNDIIAGTESTYLVNSVSINNESRLYSVRVQNNGSLCSWVSASYLVLQSNGVPPPVGLLSQTFPAGATLANIVVSGTNVRWYSSATNRTVLSIPLLPNTVLVDGMTYYASQTINGSESAERLPVTVHVALGINNPEILLLSYAPNPVKNTLLLRSANVLKKVTVYTMLGQKVMEHDCNATDVNLDLSSIAIGNYVLKVQDDTNQKTIRILKE